MKSEMDKRLSDLVSFSKSFKLNKPIPDDLVPILAKDEDKQRAIKEKSTRDAEDTKARSIGVSTTIAAAPGVRPIPAPGKAGADTSRAAPVAKPPGASSSGSSMSKTATAPSKPGDGSKKISMFIQPIPPFKGKRASAAAAPTTAQLQPVAPSTNGAAKPAASPLSPTAQNRLNVNASSFRPNVKASAFSPVSVVVVSTSLRWNVQLTAHVCRVVLRVRMPTARRLLLRLITASRRSRRTPRLRVPPTPSLARV